MDDKQLEALVNHFAIESGGGMGIGTIYGDLALAVGKAVRERCERTNAPEFTPQMIDAIYAAWHGAGVDVAGGNWTRFVDMLPKPNAELTGACTAAPTRADASGRPVE